MSHNALFQRCVTSPPPFAAEIYRGRSDSIRFCSLQVKFFVDVLLLLFLCCLLLVLGLLITFASSSSLFFYFSLSSSSYLLIFTSSFLIQFFPLTIFILFSFVLPFFYLYFFFSSSKYVGHCVEHLDVQMPFIRFLSVRNSFSLHIRESIKTILR